MKKDQCSAGPKQRKAKPGEVYAFYVELRELDFDSIPKEAGLYLKKRRGGKLDRLSVTHLREDIFAAMQKLYEECILHGECGQADERAAPFTLSRILDIMDEVWEGW